MTYNTYNNVGTKRVIDEVRQRPALWDSSNELYKDRDARARSWIDIYESIFPEYDNLPEVTKRDIEKMVHQRWKTSRDAYIRCRNNLINGSKKTKKKVYIYFEELKFLNKTDTVYEEPSSDQKTSSTKNQDKVCRTSQEDIPCASNHDASYVVTHENLSSREKLRNEDFHKSQRKRKRLNLKNDKINTEMPTIFNQNPELAANDDLSFFMSLLPITAKFNMNQKLMFRMEVLRKAMELVNETGSYESANRNLSSSDSSEEMANNPNMLEEVCIKLENIDDD